MHRRDTPSPYAPKPPDARAARRPPGAQAWVCSPSARRRAPPAGGCGSGSIRPSARRPGYRRAQADLQGVRGSPCRDGQLASIVVERSHNPATVEPAEWECWAATDAECSGYDLDLEARQWSSPNSPPWSSCRGWRIVRPARGPWCWGHRRRNDSHAPRDTSDQVLIAAAWSKAAALAEVRAGRAGSDRETANCGKCSAQLGTAGSRRRPGRLAQGSAGL